MNYIRKRIYFVIGLVGTVLLSSASSIAMNNPVPSDTAPVVIALGDSVTYGVRADHSVLPNQIFTSRLEQSLSPDFPGLTMINAGVPGNNTQDILRRLDRDVLQKKPNLVILMIGINDSAYVDAGPVARQQPRVPIKEFRKNILEIVHRIESAGSAVLLVTPNPISRAYLYSNIGYYRDHEMNATLKKYVKVIVSVGADKHIPVVNVFQAWTSSDSYSKYLVDGIHPTPEGHAQIASMLAPECKLLLAKTRSK